jgi:hypothetical protein
VKLGPAQVETQIAGGGEGGDYVKV